jgi:hypothetical protein
VFALFIDENLWFAKTCVGTPSQPPPPDTARACLLEEIPKLRQFIVTLPVDRPEVPYRLSGFERALLQRYTKYPVGIVNGISFDAPMDAVRAGLVRVFRAILPAKFNPHYENEKATAVTEYMSAVGADSASLEADRYIVVDGYMPHNGSLGGMFIVDMATGDAVLAIISTLQAYGMAPTLDLWEKSCIPQSLKDFALNRVRERANKSADKWHAVMNKGEPRVDLRETVNPMPCS